MRYLAEMFPVSLRPHNTRPPILLAAKLRNLLRDIRTRQLLGHSLGTFLLEGDDDIRLKALD